MSSESDDASKRSSSEHYDIVGVDLDWFLILGSASSIFFGFLLKITVNPPSYFTLLDKTTLLTALYSVVVSTTMFIMPVIYHTNHYRKFDVDRFVFRTRRYIMIGIICIMLAMYLSWIGLGLQTTNSDCIQFSFFPIHLCCFSIFQGYTKIFQRHKYGISNLTKTMTLFAMVFAKGPNLKQ